MSEEQGKSKPADPFEAFRGMRDAYLDSMSKAMIEAVNTEEYAQATGAMLNGCLAYAAPVREAVDKAMVAALEQLSLPSRQQIVSLAERFTNIEMRIDDLDAKLDRVVELLSATRQPPEGIAPESAPEATAEADFPRQVSARKVKRSI